MAVDGDAIEARIGYWSNCESSLSSPWTRITAFPLAWITNFQDVLARVDGGDPGDENDGD